MRDLAMILFPASLERLDATTDAQSMSAATRGRSQLIYNLSLALLLACPVERRRTTQRKASANSARLNMAQGFVETTGGKVDAYPSRAERQGAVDVVPWGSGGLFAAITGGRRLSSPSSPLSFIVLAGSAKGSSTSVHGSSRSAHGSRGPQESEGGTARFRPSADISFQDIPRRRDANPRGRGRFP
jgi:hypothetical protein